MLCEPVRTALNTLVKIGLAKKRMFPSQLNCKFPFVFTNIAKCAVVKELSRRIGTRAHPVADATPPVPMSAEIVPIAAVPHPRHLRVYSSHYYDKDLEDDRPVNSRALLRAAERARNYVLFCSRKRKLKPRIVVILRM